MEPYDYAVRRANAILDVRIIIVHFELRRKL